MKYYIAITEINPREVATNYIIPCKSEKEAQIIMETKATNSLYQEIYQTILTDKSKRK